MGFGNTAKKLQKVTTAAEDLYEKMNQLRGQIQSLRDEVETTSEQVDGIETALAEQRAILEAIAETEDIDVETVIADAHTEAVEVGAEASAAAGDEGDEEPQSATGKSEDDTPSSDA